MLVWIAVLLGIQFSLGCSDRSGPDPVLASGPPPPPIENPLVPYLDPKRLYLRSDVALIMDAPDGRVLYEKNIDTRQPIASLTKLMTAMVILDAGLPEDEVITITRADRDRLRGSGSKLSFGTRLTRHDLLKIALAASENRAAAALGRTYSGGTDAMVTAMNEKAQRLGMQDTVFRDPAGLHQGNLSTAGDLYTLVEAAYRYPEIREFSTLGNGYVTDLRAGWKIRFVNTNRLVRNGKWNIDLSKTGYIAQAGHCLVMRAEIADRPVIVVLLNSWGELTKYGDANRIRKWFDRAEKKAQEAPHPSDEATG
jgi:serine-type D-Ala-D-Ala endopeptidase (penicillin-binding protein 7)